MECQRRESSFNCRLSTRAIMPRHYHLDPLMFIEEAFGTFKNVIDEELRIHIMLKVNLTFIAEFIKASSDGDEIEKFYFNSGNNIIDQASDLSLWYSENVYTKFVEKLSEFQERGSSWALYRIIELLINVNKYEPINGSSYIELPTFIQKKGA